jgi:hypothetical protein
MQIKLCFAAQFVGSIYKDVEVPNNATDDYIKSLFSEEIGLEFDDNCWWEKISE